MRWNVVKCFQIYINLNTYVFLMSSLDAAICSAVYVKLLFRIFKKPDAISSGDGNGKAWGGVGVVDVRRAENITASMAPGEGYSFRE